MTLLTGILTILCFVAAVIVAAALKWRYPKRVMWGEMLLIVLPPLLLLPLGRFVTGNKHVLLFNRPRASSRSIRRSR